jgi:hypothetical protein
VNLRLRRWLRAWPTLRFYLFCAGLVLAGFGVVFWWPHERWPGHEAATGVAHALIIAGILAGSVDSFVKQRLLREVSRDSMEYLLGYGLPKLVQTRIRALMATSLIRSEYEQRYRLEETAAGTVRVHVAFSYILENYGTDAEEYNQMLQVGLHERPSVLSMACLSSDLAAQYDLQGSKLREYEKEENRDTLCFEGPTLLIQPIRKEIVYRFFGQFFIEPSDPTDMLSFGMTTIGVTVLAEVPAGYTFRSASFPKDALKSGNTWRYDRAFLTGEHLRFNWKKVDE